MTYTVFADEVLSLRIQSYVVVNSIMRWPINEPLGLFMLKVGDVCTCMFCFPRIVWLK